MTLPSATVWRTQRAGPVVFTNGVFDLLHPGHIALLEAARAAGSHLIVGVNSDRSVRRLGKGGDRPRVPQSDRALLVAALESVDLVVLFEEDTPIELIRALHPEVLAKGGDYSRSTIVGAAEVEAAGGRLVIIPLLPGYSTTAQLERLRVPS